MSSFIAEVAPSARTPQTLVSGYTLKVKDLPQDSGKQLCVFRRGPEGRWRVAAASFSSDLPVPGGEVRG